MSAISFLHTLPANIIRDTVILAFQRGSCTNSSLDNLADDEVKRLLDLSHICKSWRDISLSILCHTYTISAAAQTRAASSILADSVYFGYSRRLDVHMDDQDMANDNALLLFGKPEYENLYLPCVNIVNVHMRGTFATGQIYYNIEDVRTVATRIKAVAPNALSVRIKHGEYPLARGRDYWTAVDSFADSLYSKPQTYILDIGTHYRTFQNGLCEERMLTSLSFVWCERSSDAFKLLDAHCATLQDLRIYGIHTHDISRLLVSDSGSPITYPYLLALTLDGQDDIELTDRPVFKNTVPFPRLTKLNTNIVYPFGDDILFRGNCSTLEELSFNFDANGIGIVNSARVFVPGKYKKLSTLKICSFIEAIDHNDRQVKQHISLLQNISTTVQSLHICDIDISQCFVNELPKSKKFKSIHTLNLGELHLDLPDVVEILKALPALQQLESGLARSLAVAGKPHFRNPDQVCSKYSEVSRSFSGWTVSKDSIICIASSALYAVVLARICPNFNNIQLPHQLQREYFGLVKQFTRSQYFLMHPGIQSRLLSIAPKRNTHARA